MDRVKRMAICYDFDKTLSPNDMQNFKLVPSFGVDVKKFWDDVVLRAEQNRMDTNLAWMYELLRYSKFMNKPISKDYLRECGKSVILYPGLSEWFVRLKNFAAERGIELEHYIISSGLRETIEGTSIAGAFKRIYASSYMYSVDGIAEWPAQAVNYTTKTQYIFRIAKGIMEEYDDSVNQSMADKDLRIPYENIVYIGDSMTDIPCMRLVKSKGGMSIGVYDKVKGDTTKVEGLLRDGRLSFYAAADYGEGSELDIYMKSVIDAVAKR